MIPTGSTLIRISEHKGKVIRIYALGRKLWVSVTKRHRLNTAEVFPVEEMPDSLKTHILNELYSRQTVIPLAVAKA